MAKRRLKELSEGERVVLTNLEQAFPGSTAYATKEGKVDPRVISFFQQQSAKDPEGIKLQLDRLSSIVEKVGKRYTKSELDKYLKETEDVGGLGEDELGERLEAFEELGELKPEKVSKFSDFKNLITEEIMGQVEGQLPGHSIGRGQAEKVSNAIADRLFKGEDVAGQEIAERIKDNYLDPSGGIILNDKEFKRLKGYVVDRVREVGLTRRSEFQDTEGTPIDVSEDVKSLQDLISGKETRRKREGELEEFIGGLESELSRGREEFVSGEQEYAKGIFERELKPQIEESLNVRGLLYSGDLASELARTATGLQTDIEQQALSLQEEDDLFFQNVAYFDTFRKEIAAGEDVSAKLGFERTQQRNRQQFDFASTQSNLRRRYEEESYRRQLERAQSAQESNLRRQRDAATKQRTTDIIGGIGQAVGQIGGAYAGGKLSQGGVVSSKGVTSG